MEPARAFLSGLWLSGAVLLGAGNAIGSELPAAWRFPPLAGSVTGEFRPLTIPDAPRLQWTLTVEPRPARQRHVTLAVDGPGTKVAAELMLDPAGFGGWTLQEADVDLQVWSASVVGWLGEEFASAQARGRLRVEGAGELQANGVSGQARLQLRDGRIEAPDRKVNLGGITLDVALEDLQARRSPPAQTLSWTEGAVDTLALGEGRVVFSLAGEEVRVDEASVELLGGKLVVASFAFSTVRREFTVIARLVGIDVAYLLPYLPSVLKSARGRVDGLVTLHRSPSGLRIGRGTLELRAGESADLQFVPTPGLLSGSLPEPVLKAYPGLGAIESGEIPLRAERLEVAFTPEGDSQGRTASVRIVGGPDDPRLKAPVDLNINVRGPLETLLKFGTDGRIQFGGK